MKPRARLLDLALALLIPSPEGKENETATVEMGRGDSWLDVDRCPAPACRRAQSHRPVFRQAPEIPRGLRRLLYRRRGFRRRRQIGSGRVELLEGEGGNPDRR